MKRWFRPAGTPAYFGAALLQCKKADVVHVTGLLSVCSMQALAAALVARRPVVLSPRGALEPGALNFGPVLRKRAWLQAFHPMLRRVSLFHATSEDESRSIVREFGRFARTVVIPNGTSIDRISSVLARRDRATGEPILGFVGRIHPIKGLERLLEAAAILRDRRLNFRVRLAGPDDDPNYRVGLERKARDLGVADRLEFVGEILGEAKDDFYAQCRVLALPSHSENFGNVVVEALAQGTPVVASRGTPWSKLEAWGCGRWVDNTPIALADAIAPYLSDASAARRAGAAGRERVEQLYSWEVVATNMIAAYEEVLAARNRVIRKRTMAENRGDSC
jgi:glycosyltransferase involved in cell wall biosynthesis